MNTIKYGDTIFIILPALNKPMIFSGSEPHYTNATQYEYVPSLISADINSADPYTIEPVGDANIGDDITPNSIFRLKENLYGYYLYDLNSIVYQGDVTDNRSQWRIEPTDNSTNVVTYNQEFKLVNQSTGGDAGLEDTNNLIITSSREDNNNYVFKFLPGPFEYAKSQCCQNNSIYHNPNVCGTNQPNSQSCNDMQPNIQLSTQVTTTPATSTGMVDSQYNVSSSQQIEMLTPVGSSNANSYRTWYIIGGIILLVIIIAIIILIFIKMRK
ncbi:hypothetical protein QKC54_gp0164 [Megavirus baoshan]|uniref:Uncharacterized protein n=1 Tax=Megavirus baoshan TaxID=2496520 RepID=A0A3Q8U8J0_9VIRU|nr:hypothetical protein QKC54_gp0164 [Megavirus baoshan]AZL89753.1 hypothetical protein Mb0908 [Megavirus baoshan]